MNARLPFVVALVIGCVACGDTTNNDSVNAENSENTGESTNLKAQPRPGTHHGNLIAGCDGAKTEPFCHKVPT